jgi:pimeloyl-ACP methyl ester carboxylesterase
MLLLLACRALDWQECDDGFECATLDADGAAIAVVRHAGGTERVAVFASGGPGVSSIDEIEWLVPNWGDDDPELWQDTTWVAMDNRGVGRTDPLDCVGDDWYADVRWREPIPATEEDAAALRASRDAFQAGCLADTPADELARLDSATYADDLDTFRDALGADTLDFLGVSAGTYVGALYAARHPDGVGRFVLDGVVGPDATRDGFLRDQTAGMEAALQRFFERCDVDPDCPIGPDAAAVYDRVLAASLAAPIPAPSDAHGRVATRNEVRWAVASLLYGPYDEDLGAALAAADAGDGGPLLLAGDDGWGFDGEHYDPSYQRYWGIGCVDQPWPSDWTEDDVWAFGRELEAASPRIGSSILTGELTCLGWPAAAPEVSLASTAPPLWLVNGLYDPATPYDGAEAMQDALGNGSTLLPFDGDGHVAMFTDTTGCAYEAERAVLLTGTTSVEACP